MKTDMKITNVQSLCYPFLALLYDQVYSTAMGMIQKARIFPSDYEMEFPERALTRLNAN